MVIHDGGDGYDAGAADSRRAAELRALADQLETVVDAALAASRTDLWVCANADDVRGQLGSYQTRVRSAAQNLREEAMTAENDARRKREAAVTTGAG